MEFQPPQELPSQPVAAPGDRPAEHALALATAVMALALALSIAEVLQPCTR